MAHEPDAQYPVGDDQQAAPQPPVNVAVQPAAAAGAAQDNSNGPELEVLKSCFIKFPIYRHFISSIIHRASMMLVAVFVVHFISI